MGQYFFDSGDQNIDTLSRQTGNGIRRVHQKVSLGPHRYIAILSQILRNFFLRHQENPQIRRRRTFPGQGHAHCFDLVLGLAQAGSIQQGDRQTRKVHANLDHVARCSCDLRRDRRCAARQGIQKRGFARIRRTNNRDFKARADPLCYANTLYLMG